VGRSATWRRLAPTHFNISKGFASRPAYVFEHTIFPQLGLEFGEEIFCVYFTLTAIPLRHVLVVTARFPRARVIGNRRSTLICNSSRPLTELFVPRSQVSRLSRGIFTALDSTFSIRKVLTSFVHVKSLYPL
jgi:hypothetical protein